MIFVVLLLTNLDTTNPTIKVTVSSKVATLVLTDNIGIVGYGVNQSTSTQPNYTSASGTSASKTWAASASGTYVAWVKDNAGRTAYAQFTIASTAFCAYSAGQVWNYAYTGNTQSFTVPCSGTYKLEVWGAQGGTATYEDELWGEETTFTANGGLGGYAYGNTSLTANSTLYVVVGGVGTSVSSGFSTSVNVGGYNGGGNGYARDDAASGGGGATHIGTFNKTLASHKSTSGLYIVAGGGGGGRAYGHLTSYGGTGGGTSGGNGYYGTTSDIKGYGGSQSSGGSGDISGSFGQGGSCGTSYQAGGGGGGLYGGGASATGGAGGGSGYIGGVTGGSMSNGQRSGNGYARITLVSLN